MVCGCFGVVVHLSVFWVWFWRVSVFFGGGGLLVCGVLWFFCSWWCVFGGLCFDCSVESC